MTEHLHYARSRVERLLTQPDDGLPTVGRAPNEDGVSKR
jgi:hypothetical protein